MTCRICGRETPSGNLDAYGSCGACAEWAHLYDPQACCLGVNGSHAHRCERQEPVPYDPKAEQTVRCWCCMRDLPSHWAGLWSYKGYRCFSCEGHPFVGLGCGLGAAVERTWI